MRLQYLLSGDLLEMDKSDTRMGERNVDRK